MLLSNPHRPDPRVLLEARALKSAGYELHLVAWDREQTRPIEADEGGVHVIRLGPKAPQRAPTRILVNLPRFWLRALRASRRLRFDIIHAHDFDTLPLGMAISRLTGKPLLYDAHELYAKMIEDEVGPLSKAVWFFERMCSARADAVITVSEAVADELSKGRGDRARVVSTSQDPSVIEGADVQAIRRRYGLKGFVVSYLGSLEPGRFIEETLTSFAPSDGITVLVGGSGTLKEVVESEAARNPAIKYIGTVDADEALRLTWASDLVVAMMDPANPNNVIGTPGKIINAMSVGRAIITTEGLDIARRVREAKCGIVVPYEKRAFVEAVKRAVAEPKPLLEMGRRGRELYDREFSWTRSRDELLRTYQSLVRSS
jgi:glycosyltransferase involved in cell wall biosynthesis